MISLYEACCLQNSIVLQKAPPYSPLLLPLNASNNISQSTKRPGSLSL